MSEMGEFTAFVERAIELAKVTSDQAETIADKMHPASPRIGETDYSKGIREGFYQGMMYIIEKLKI